MKFDYGDDGGILQSGLQFLRTAAAASQIREQIVSKHLPSSRCKISLRIYHLEADEAFG